jgi:hypothetical protein
VDGHSGDPSALLGRRRPGLNGRSFGGSANGRAHVPLQRAHAVVGGPSPLVNVHVPRERERNGYAQLAIVGSVPVPEMAMPVSPVQSPRFARPSAPRFQQRRPPEQPVDPRPVAAAGRALHQEALAIGGHGVVAVVGDLDHSLQVAGRDERGAAVGGHGDRTAAASATVVVSRSDAGTSEPHPSKGAGRGEDRWSVGV